MRFVYFSVLFLILNIKAEAQKDLFESTKLPARKGWLIGVNANYDMAQADIELGHRYITNLKTTGFLELNWTLLAEAKLRQLETHL
jgi:hypothetical protein